MNKNTWRKQWNVVNQNDRKGIKFMQSQVQEKLRMLFVKKESIEVEIQKWQVAFDEIKKIESELSLLQERIISLSEDKGKESLRNQIQVLLHKQKDICWDAQSYEERLETRKLNFVTFKKQPNYSDDRHSFELALNHYTAYLLDIVSRNKRIWWTGLPFSRRERYLGILSKELFGVLEKRNAVNLLPEATITSILHDLSKAAFRNKFSDEERSNFTDFRDLFRQIHVLKRDEVYFF